MMPSGWEKVTLSDIVKIVDSLHKTPAFSDQGYPMVRVTDLKGGRLSLNNTVKVSKEVFEEFSKNHKPKHGDIIFSRVGSFGIPAYVDTDEPFCLGQNTIVISPSQKVSSRFLYNMFLSSGIQSEFLRTVDGSSQKTLSLKTIRSLELLIPPKNEQEKIAKILSTWDEAIERLDNTTKLVSELKQNLLHKIIYKNQLHHKENWSLKPVSELFEILDNKRKPLNSSQRQNMKGEVPYYGANGQVGAVDDFIFDEPLILLAEDGGYFDEYKTRPIAYRVYGKSWVNNHAHVLRAKNELSFDYLYFTLVHKNILPFLNGGTRAKLNKAVLETIEIPIPNKLDEQVAIGNLFNSLEKKEDLLRKKTYSIKLQKEALMQQLLTGKKRVRI